MIRNISTLKTAKFSTLSAPPAGSQFHIPMALAITIASSIYGDVSVTKDNVERLLDRAFKNGLFAYRVAVY